MNAARGLRSHNHSRSSSLPPPGYYMKKARCSYNLLRIHCEASDPRGSNIEGVYTDIAFRQLSSSACRKLFVGRLIHWPIRTRMFQSIPLEGCMISRQILFDISEGSAVPSLCLLCTWWWFVRNNNANSNKRYVVCNNVLCNISSKNQQGWTYCHSVIVRRCHTEEWRLNCSCRRGPVRSPFYHRGFIRHRRSSHLCIELVRPLTHEVWKYLLIFYRRCRGIMDLT